MSGEREVIEAARQWRYARIERRIMKLAWDDRAPNVSLGDVEDAARAVESAASALEAAVRNLDEADR